MRLTSFFLLLFRLAEFMNLIQKPVKPEQQRSQQDGNENDQHEQFLPPDGNNRTTG